MLPCSTRSTHQIHSVQIYSIPNTTVQSQRTSLPIGRREAAMAWGLHLSQAVPSPSVLSSPQKNSKKKHAFKPPPAAGSLIHFFSLTSVYFLCARYRTEVSQQPPRPSICSPASRFSSDKGFYLRSAMGDAGKLLPCNRVSWRRGRSLSSCE